LEQLRDEYGYKKYIFTQSVAPFKSGELPLQHYNNLLCLSHLHEYADSIGLHQNDDVFNILDRASQHADASRSLTASKTGLLPNKKSTNPASSTTESLSSNSISFRDINCYIVKSFLNALYPVESVSLKTQSIGMEFLEMQRVLCSHRSLKLLEFYNVSKSESKQTMSANADAYHKTHPMLKQILSLLPKYKTDLAAPVNEPYKSLGSIVVARGFNEITSRYLVEDLWKDVEPIRKALNPVAWNSNSAVDFWYAKNGINESGGVKPSSTATASVNTSITIVTNRNKCIEYVRDVATKAELKYRARAYVHWYERFGVCGEEFDHAFENARHVVDAYTEFTR
jgi:hypothetical protein